MTTYQVVAYSYDGDEIKANDALYDRQHTQTPDQSEMAFVISILDTYTSHGPTIYGGSTLLGVINMLYHVSRDTHPNYGSVITLMQNDKICSIWLYSPGESHKSHKRLKQLM